MVQLSPSSHSMLSLKPCTEELRKMSVFKSLSHGSSFSTVWVGWSFFLYPQSGHRFTRLLWNNWLAHLSSPYPTGSVDVMTALVCGRVGQRLGKTEGKICAGYNSVPKLNISSQKKFKKQCQSYRLFSFSCSCHCHSHGILLFKCRCLYLTLLFKCCYGTMETNAPFWLFYLISK